MGIRLGVTMGQSSNEVWPSLMCPHCASHYNSSGPGHHTWAFTSAVQHARTLAVFLMFHVPSCSVLFKYSIYWFKIKFLRIHNRCPSSSVHVMSILAHLGEEPTLEVLIWAPLSPFQHGPFLPLPCSCFGSWVGIFLNSSVRSPPFLPPCHHIKA